MDDFSGAQESILEYSDTSGEEREDAYFMPDLATGGPKNLLGGDERGYSGESAFRSLRSGGSKSSRVLKFSSDGSTSLSYSQHQHYEDELYPDPASSSKPGYSSYASSKSKTLKSWMENLAYSFRSPKIGASRHTSTTPNGAKYRSNAASAIMEYPNSTTTLPLKHSLGHYTSSHSALHPIDEWERAPLIANDNKTPTTYGGDFIHATGGQPLKSKAGDSADRENSESKPRPVTLKSKSTAATVAAFYLMDYEASRPPTLSSNFDTITPWQLKIYKIQFSWMWRLFGINLAIIVMFLAHSQNRLVTALMHTYTIIIFSIELWMREQLYSLEPSSDYYHSERQLNRPLILFLLVLGLESWVWYIFPPDPQAEVPTLVSSIFKPVVFFYVSLKARNALEGLARITRIVTRVLMIEMLLILAFASVGCQLFHQYDSFKDLSSSWLSLFERKCVLHASSPCCGIDVLTPSQFSVDDGCQSKSVDANVRGVTVKCHFLCILYNCERILSALSGFVGCIPNIHPRRNRDPR